MQEKKEKKGKYKTSWYHSGHSKLGSINSQKQGFGKRKKR
jgi:hypothetical protein